MITSCDFFDLQCGKSFVGDYGIMARFFSAPALGSMVAIG